MTVEREYDVSELREGGALTETPNPDATEPTGMCGSPKKCERCPSDFLCWTKAKAEMEIIKKEMTVADIVPTMALECHECDWRPPEGETMAVVERHFNQKHPGPEGREVKMNLRAICTCGKAMQHVSSSVVGQFVGDEGQMMNKVNDRFWCPFDNQFGTVRRHEAVELPGEGQDQ